MTTKSFINHRVLWLLIPLLTLFNLSVWGDSKTTTFADYSSGTWATNKNPLPCASGGWSWASSATPNSFESAGSARGLQWSSATSTYLTTTQTGTITQVSIVASTNGTVSLSVTVGGTDFKNGNNTSLSVSSTANQTYTFSGSASGEISVYVNNTNKSAYVKSISVTYSTAPASKYTVTFNTGAGNPSQSDITEATAGGGVTLPSVTPTCSGDGWALYGWATSACGSETSTAPTIVGKTGDTYKPESNITLYAVYAKGEYTKETSSITSGSKYLIVGASGGHNYIMKSSSDDMHDYSGYTGMAAAQIDETSSGAYHAAAVDATWCYTISGSVGAYYIRDVVNSSSSNYLDLYFESFWGKSYYSEDSYTITVSSGKWTIKHNDVSNTYLGLDGSDEAFFNYSSAQNILLYKAGTIKYLSSPSCASCDNDPTVTAASNNGSFL